MSEKFLTMALKRIDIDETDRIYVPISITAGNIDNETDILTTYVGKKYKRITDYSENDETIAGYYYDLMETDKIPLSMNSYKDFEEQYKDITYYTSKVGDTTVIKSLDKKENQRHVTSTCSYADEENNADKNFTQGVIELEVDNDVITDAIKDIVCRVVTDQFSSDELIDLQEQLEDVREEADAAIESIKLKQEALEGDTQEIHNKKEVSKTTTKVPTPTQLQDNYSNKDQIDIQSLFNKITKVLIAQDEAARRAIVEISRLNDMEYKEYGILLTGDTGVGKTLLMNLISSYINRPFLKIDSTQLTAPAYAGRSLEQYLWELYEKCGRNKDLAETAIIYFDEIDKKGSDKKNDANGKSVQDTLLKFIEGTEYIATKNPQQVTQDTSVTLKTDNMIIVGSGAFIDVYKSKNSTNKPEQIGFQMTKETKEIENTTLQNEPSVEDFIKIGQMTSELMGRLPIVIHLNDLDIDNIVSIILSSDKSALKQQQAVFSKRGVKLSTKEGYILSIAEQAFDRKIGARGLNKLIADSTWHAYDKICCEPNTYEEVILTKETATDSTNYQLIKKKN